MFLSVEIETKWPKYGQIYGKSQPPETCLFIIQQSLKIFLHLKHKTQFLSWLWNFFDRLFEIAMYVSNVVLNVVQATFLVAHGT